MGPGTYRELDNITKKPCMTTLHRPEVALASTEEYFDIQGHLRLLQTSYMPKKEREGYEQMSARVKAKLGSKVNDTLVYRKYRMSKATFDCYSSPGDCVGSLKLRAAAAQAAEQSGGGGSPRLQK